MSAPKPSKLDMDLVQEGEKAKQIEEKILEKPLPWAAYYEAKSITLDEKSLLEGYVAQGPEGRLDLFREIGDKHAALFLKTLSAIRIEEVTKYILTLIDQVLQVDPSQAAVFHKFPDAYAPFLRVINRETESDPYSVKKASRILSVLLGSAPDGTPAVSDFISWLITKLAVAQGTELIYIVTYLKDILKTPAHRTLFVQKEGLTRLVALLQKDSQNTQLLYLIGFCIWLLTFNSECFPALKHANVVKELTKIARVNVREKIIRICFSTFRNLLDREEKFNEDMIGFGLVKIAQGLSQRTWKDKDIEEDIKVVQQKLEKSVEELSSFEMYVTEIQAGNLSWTPVHSELFWRENVVKFERENFDLIQKLIDMLDTKDETQLEVACYDLGEFARFYPDGKSIIEKFKGKGRLMSCLAHTQPKVRKQALLCVQKLMVNNWEFFNKGTKGAKGKEGKESKEKE